MIMPSGVDWFQDHESNLRGGSQSSRLAYLVDGTILPNVFIFLHQGAPSCRLADKQTWGFPRLIAKGHCKCFCSGGADYELGTNCTTCCSAHVHTPPQMSAQPSRCCIFIQVTPRIIHFHSPNYSRLIQISRTT